MPYHVFNVLLKKREGRILCVALIIYLGIGVAAEFSAQAASQLRFIGFMGFFMPVFLVGFFLKLGGHRRDFESSWFNTGIMLLVSLIPVFVEIKSALLR